jgi:hypothetical protein
LYLLLLFSLKNWWGGIAFFLYKTRTMQIKSVYTAVAGFEPGSSVPQEGAMTTAPLHQGENLQIVINLEKRIKFHL